MTWETSTLWVRQPLLQSSLRLVSNLQIPVKFALHMSGLIDAAVIESTLIVIIQICRSAVDRADTICGSGSRYFPSSIKRFLISNLHGYPEWGRVRYGARMRMRCSKAAMVQVLLVLMLTLPLQM